jgi:hypothetical protein
MIHDRQHERIRPTRCEHTAELVPNHRQRQRPKQKSSPPTTTLTNTRRSSYQDICHYTSGANSTVATSPAMQTTTKASSDASKASHDRMVRMVQTLVQSAPSNHRKAAKCTIQSPQSGSLVFDWLGLGMTCAATPCPSMSPSSTIIDNLSSRYRAHRNRLQPSRTHAT